MRNKVELSEEQINALQDAFWKKMLEMFPEVTTGDLEPLVVMEFKDNVETVGNAWLSLNHPENEEEFE